MEKALYLIDKLYAERHLELEEYESLLSSYSPQVAQYVADKANQVRKNIYGNQIFVRGLIEISNICKNNCLYCGIRKANKECDRYRLTKEEILCCCKEGYELGIRTFVLQGGEDGYFHDKMLCSIVAEIKTQFPDCAVTLSMGERSRESYEALYKAGADRYLLRHETADKNHYDMLHPAEMSFSNRMRCLQDLKEIGYQTGCGFMVGSPYQTLKTLAKDFQFMGNFQPQMCGIGPFIPHKATEFRGETAGSVDFTCYLLSLIRLLCPSILLPATTALGTLDSKGREKGILAGANVVMPNLSPKAVRKKYELYNDKLSDGEEAVQGIESLKKRIKAISYEIVTDRGDWIRN